MLAKIFIVIVTLAAAFSQPLLQCSTKGCATCEAGKCKMCYQSVFDDFGNCTQYPYFFHGCELALSYRTCLMCEPGRALLYTGRMNSNLRQPYPKCTKVQNPILNCVDERSNGDGSTFCATCKGGYPSKDGKSCTGWQEVESKGFLRQPLNPCLWGKRDFETGKTSCARCQPSMAVVNGTCQTATVQGCLLEDESGSCKICNVWLGYSMVSSMSCQL